MYLENLLQQCTVKLTIPGRQGWGTGFFVAPGLILTCAHVVDGAGESPIQVMWNNQENWAQAVVVRSLPKPYDLALLKVDLPIDDNPPCVYLNSEIQSRDPLYLFGYPDINFSHGCPVTFGCEGLTGGDPKEIKFALGQVRPGMSGSPLLNQRTGDVCGIVTYTLDRTSLLGGGAIPTSVILAKFPELLEQQKSFNQENQRWYLARRLKQIDHIPRNLLRSGLFISLGATVAISLARFFGVLQPLELKAYDFVLRSRPAEIQDDNILVIEIDGFTEPDRSNKINTLSDDRLDKLLQRILPYKPKIVGFDNFLSHPIDSKKYETLYESLRTGNLVAVCQAQVQNGDSFKAPDSASSVGFGDIAVDSDKIVRRHLLSMKFNSGFCSQPDYALSALLANQYFEDPKQKLSNRKLQLDLGKVRGKQLSFLGNNMGGYWKLDPDSKKEDHGYQVMLNYRFNSSLLDGVNSSSINDIFNLPPKELESKIKDHIVLIGTTNSYYPDFHETPYGTIPGVFLQAQMTSQLLNAALYDRPLIWAYPVWGEIPMILLASVTGALLSWRVRKAWILLGCGGGVIAILFVGSVALLKEVGYWFPLVPVGLGFTIVCIGVTIYLLWETKPE